VCFYQKNVWKWEADAAGCKTVYISEYVIIYFQQHSKLKYLLLALLVVAEKMHQAGYLV